MSERAKKYQPELLAPVPDWNMEIWRVHLDDIKEQDINPRVQPPGMIEQLISTIGKQQRLESIPFVAKREKDDGSLWFELISGHHRLRSAKAAGLQTIIVLADITGLSRDEIIAKQLSHNNINGKTDFQIAERLYNEINDIDAKIESFMTGIDKKSNYDLMVKSVTANIDWKNISFLFLPKSIDDFDSLIDSVQGMNNIYVCHFDDYDKFTHAINKIKECESIRNTGAVIDFMVEAALEKISAIKDSNQDFRVEALRPSH